MKKLLLLTLLFAFATHLLAVPARPGIRKTVRLADGTVVKVELRGDEYMRFWQAEDGKTYVKQPDSEIFVAKDIKELRAEAFQKRMQAPLAKSQTRADIGEKSKYIGAKKGLIILAEFTDMKFRDGHDKEFYTHIANDLNFKDEKNGFVGSIRDYFLDQSYGLFDLTFDIVGPVSLSHEVAYYGKNTESGSDAKPREMIVEAVKAAANILPSFDDYDWFGDGYVDQVFVIYAGRGESDGGGDDTIWPHRWEIWPTQTFGGKKISVYACSNEMQSKNAVDGIGTFCHEFSHCLGLPDLYDVKNQQYYGMGWWDVMDGGCYCGNSFRPCGYSGYERNHCGWKEAVVLNRDTLINDMKGIAEGGDFYIVYNDANHDEYYVLENRNKTGWDSEQYGSGLLITHIDYNEKCWEENVVNSNDPGINDHQRYSIFLADNNTSNKTRKDIEGDVYPFETNNSLTNETVPAAMLFNKNTDGTYYINKPITHIRRNLLKNTISFNFTNNNGTASIKPIQIISQEPKVYTIDGRSITSSPESLDRGLYIIGKKKIIKK